MSNQLSASYVKHLLFVAAAGVGALAFVPRAIAGNPDASATNSPSVDQPALNKSMQTPHLPDGFVEKDEDAATGVKTTLVQLTQRAVAKNSYDSFFSGFLSDLAARDKARAREFKGADQQHLNEAIGKIQTQWLAKYGQDFDVSEKNLALDERFPIVQGEVSDPTAAAASNWPAAASEGLALNVSAEQQACNAKALTKGQAVAIIRFPAGDGMPDMNVSLIHQVATGWYVALPVDRTGEQMYNDLSSHLTYIADHQDQWPTDVSQAYRMVARNVAAALYGVSSPTGTASAQ